jgi:PAS domain S-box-containing protein
MTRKDRGQADAAGLRRRAEEMARVRAASAPGNDAALSPEEVQRTLHELRVHQIELELQNEEMRRAQVELDASRERYFDLYDLAPVGYFTVSRGGVILEANLTAATLLRETRGALVNKPLRRFVFPQDQDIHYKRFKHLLETGAPQAWELRLLRKDSAPFWARVEMIKAEDTRGASVCRVVVSDITERKLEEAEKTKLAAQNRQLELRQMQQERFAHQKLESVGTLASGIAHDFNNLLGGVLAQSELALQELAAGSRPEEELKTIRATAIRGSEIIRQLLIYAREESEVPELVDVSRTIEQAFELLKASVSKHVVLETDLGRDFPAVTTSPTQLLRVVLNLITNASEAIGDQDGVIRVTTRRVTVGGDGTTETLEPLTEGDYVQVEVSDTGRGIMPEIHVSVFDPFFTTKSTSPGLGLAIVHEIVRGLRGGIRMTSAPASGSTFQIFLPCAGYMGQTTRDAFSVAKEEVLEFQAGSILIVEDEENLRRPVSKMLRKAGLSVLEASDGCAALEVIRAQSVPVDVLLLDLTLPGASSREIFDESRRLRPDMKVIVTSAYNKERAAESLGASVEYFIRKPYRLGDLMESIRDCAASSWRGGG